MRNAELTLECFTKRIACCNLNLSVTLMIWYHAWCHNCHCHCHFINYKIKMLVSYVANTVVRTNIVSRRNLLNLCLGRRPDSILWFGSTRSAGPNITGNIWPQRSLVTKHKNYVKIILIGQTEHEFQANTTNTKQLHQPSTHFSWFTLTSKPLCWLIKTDQSEQAVCSEFALWLVESCATHPCNAIEAPLSAGCHQVIIIGILGRDDAQSFCAHVLHLFTYIQSNDATCQYI